MGTEDFEDGINLDGEKIKIPILVSFYGLKKNYKKPKWVNKLMLDSGAFSAWRQNVSIDFEDYIAYCTEKRKMYEVIIGLDVVNDPGTSYKNWKRMRKLGFDIMPVYHIDEPIKALYRYADETNYIGIGGIAWIDKRKKYYTLNKLFRDFPDPKIIGFHGLGVNDKDMIYKYPWSTVDASTAHIAARCGCIHTKFGFFQIIPDGSLRHQLGANMISQEKRNKLLGFLKEHGFDIDAIQKKDTTGIHERCKINIWTFEQRKMQCPDKFSSRTNYLFHKEMFE